jgi:hypothetical protein
MLEAAMQASLQQAAQSDQQLLQQAMKESRQDMPSLHMPPTAAFDVVSRPSWLPQALAAADPCAMRTLDDDDEDEEDEEDAMLAAALAASVKDASEADATLSALNRDVP